MMQNTRFGTIVALGLAYALAGCAQPPPVPDNSTDVPAAQGGVTTASCDRPIYPPQAKANKVEGTSKFGFLIDPDGAVLNTRLYKSSGDASLDEAARSALAKCRFKPALYKGKPVRAWTSVQYVWTLE